MGTQWMAAAAAGAVLIVCAARAEGQGSTNAQQEPEKPRETRWYKPTTWPNPVRWIRRDSRTASEQLAGNSDLEKKLTMQLERAEVIQRGANLTDTCQTFKSLADCVASLHASHDLELEFVCLKYDLTGVDPSSGKSPCAGPPGGKAIGLAKAIELLKPEADAKAEAKEAMRRARGDISDASS